MELLNFEMRLPRLYRFHREISLKSMIFNAFFSAVTAGFKTNSKILSQTDNALNHHLIIIDTAIENQKTPKLEERKKINHSKIQQ